MKTKTIGTDMSLDVCNDEGYLQMETSGKFNPETPYRIFCTFPEHTGLTGYRVDCPYSWNDLIKKYEARKDEMIKDYEDIQLIVATPNFYSMLQLADSISFYTEL